MWQRLVGPFGPLQPRVAQAMVLAFAISASAAFALGILFLWHAYLIFTAQVLPLYCCTTNTHQGCQPKLCLSSIVSILSIRLGLDADSKKSCRPGWPSRHTGVLMHNHPGSRSFAL